MPQWPARTLIFSFFSPKDYNCSCCWCHTAVHSSKVAASARWWQLNSEWFSHDVCRWARLGSSSTSTLSFPPGTTSTRTAWRARMIKGSSSPSPISTRRRACRSRGTWVRFPSLVLLATTPFLNFWWYIYIYYVLSVLKLTCLSISITFSTGKPWLQGWCARTAEPSPAKDWQPIHLHEIIYR